MTTLTLPKTFKTLSSVIALPSIWARDTGPNTRLSTASVR